MSLNPADKELAEEAYSDTLDFLSAGIGAAFHRITNTPQGRAAHRAIAEMDSAEFSDVVAFVLDGLLLCGYVVIDEDGVEIRKPRGF